MKLEWSKEYEIGIKKIDDDHKKLVDLIVEFDESSFGKRKELASKSIHFLSEYAIKHFTSEEEIMKNWHGNIRNKEEHKEFLQQIEFFQRQLEIKGPLFLETIIMYLKNWLIGHILKTDKGFESFYKKNENL